MASTADIKNGIVLNIDGALWTIIEFQHVKPGKGGAFVRTKMKNLMTGKVVDKTYNAGTKIDITVVREGRGKRLRETPEMFSGLVWSGEKAVALGLADGFGSLDHVAREVVKAADIVDYTQRENVAQRLARRFGAGVGESAMRALRSGALDLR